MKFTYSAGDRPLEGYTIQQGLGRGGFGEVYQALSDGGKQVALKLVQRNLEVELRGVGQCLNLKHANLVAVYDVKQAENGDQWIVMEHVAGETLDKIIARHPQGMPQEEVLAWIRGICDGVGYLHDQGLVHRDLKPGNLFVENLSPQPPSPSRRGGSGESPQPPSPTRRGGQGGEVVKIGDYGLSKFISASRRSGQTTSIGTVHYMAPEVVKGRYGKEVDLYAIGVIVYEMLTGRVPFNGETPGEILMKHLTDSPDLSLIPPAYRPVVGRLLDKDPFRRYSSVQALMADLEGYLARPPDAEPVEPILASDSRTRVEKPNLSGGELRAFALQLNQPASDPEDGPQNSWWKLDPYSAMGWLFVIAGCIGLGVGGLIGVQTYKPSADNAGEAWVTGGAIGFLTAGGVLLLLMFFHWAGKFAAPWARKFTDPDTVRKFHELDRLQRVEKSQRLSKSLGVLGRVTMALAVGLGFGLLVTGIIMTSANNPKMSEIGVGILGGGVGLLGFGLTALLAFRRRRFQEEPGHVVASSALETPVSLSGLQKQAGPPAPLQGPRQRGGTPTILGKLTLALSVALGVGLLVGGGAVNFSTNPKLGDFGVLLGCSVGLIVFGATAYGWLFDKRQKLREEPRDAHAAHRETPISGGELPQATGPWQPQSERVR